RAFRSRTARRRAFRLQPAATTAGPVSPRNRRSRQRRVRARRFPSGLNRDFHNAQTRWGSLAFSCRRLRKRDAWKLRGVANGRRNPSGKKIKRKQDQFASYPVFRVTVLFLGYPAKDPPRAFSRLSCHDSHPGRYGGGCSLTSRNNTASVAALTPTNEAEWRR